MNCCKYIELAMMLLMGLGILALLINRIHLKRGIVGIRSIQYLVVVLALPLTVILSCEGKLDGEAVAFIFGAIIGYILQGAKDEKERDPD